MKRMMNNSARPVARTTMKMYSCTAMDAKSCGTLIVLTYKRCLTEHGSVTTAEPSEKSILDHALPDPVGSRADAPVVSSADNVETRLLMT